jgi:ribosomal-protein-alanine N-acetyltransferase
MSQSQIPTIETERLLLRPVAPEDLEEWTARIFADPEVVRFVPSSTTDPHERARRMYAFIARMWAERGYGEWLVTDKADGQLIGHCGLLHVGETGETEIDYALARPYWGRGIATEAAFACLRFGFAETPLEQVIGLVVPEHIASRRVLEHVGFTYQGDARYFGHMLAYHTLQRSDFRPAASLYQLR